MPPGGGPPFHIQIREEEAFYILEGEVTFYGEDGEVVAGPGTHLNIPNPDYAKDLNPSEILAPGKSRSPLI